MAEANDSINVTPGAGASVATQLVSGKEYQVVVTANSRGQMIGDLPTYSAFSGTVASAANKVYMHIFNAAGSGKSVKIRKLFVQPSQLAVVGVPQTWRITKTSAVGTTGAVTVVPRSHDSTDPALPAQITAAHSFTAGGTETFTWFEIPLNIEETLPAVGLMAYFNLLPIDGDFVTDYVLNEGEGMKVTQITGLAYNYSVLVVFTVE